MTRAWIQFTTLRRRDRETGKPNEWRHGPFASLDAAKNAEWKIAAQFAAEPRGGPPGTKARCRCPRCVRIEVVVTGKGAWR